MCVVAAEKLSKLIYNTHTHTQKPNSWLHKQKSLLGLLKVIETSVETLEKTGFKSFFLDIKVKIVTKRRMLGFSRVPNLRG